MSNSYTSTAPALADSLLERVTRLEHCVERIERQLDELAGRNARLEQTVGVTDRPLEAVAR
jgi:phage shock protein A